MDLSQMGRAARLMRGAALFALSLAILLIPWLGGSEAYAVPPPPWPTAEVARYYAACRTPPREILPLTLTRVAAPAGADILNVGWGVRLDPPAGAHIGRVVGLVRLKFGDLLAVTNRGYWIALPMQPNGGHDLQSPPVAVSMRDLPGTPLAMAALRRPVGPSSIGTAVGIIVAGQPQLIVYGIGGCFPGAAPELDPPLPRGGRVTRLEAAMDSEPRAIVAGDDGVTRYAAIGDESTIRSGDEIVSDKVRDAVVSARIPLADGCDVVSFRRVAAATEVWTSCSAGYLPRLAEMRRTPQKRFRQPSPRRGERRAGLIAAPVVAVSNGVFGQLPKGWNELKRGPVAGAPGVPCRFALAAQTDDDAPVVIYGAQPYCAYYPRSRDAAPFPPPPPP